MRTALAALPLALCACSPSPPPKPSASAAPDTPQARLIARDAGRAGDAALMSRYADVDARFFGGRLPKVPVLWEPALQGVGVPGAPTLTLEGLWGRDASGRAVILLNDRLKADDDALQATLCHEMIHEYLDTVGRSSARHGPEFQAQLKRLHDGGAFSGEAPSEGEKDGLRDWLAKDRAALDSQARELSREQAALGPSPSRRAVADYNALVARQNIMIGDYNREARRYNALNAYPDGLDEDKTVSLR